MASFGSRKKSRRVSRRRSRRRVSRRGRRSGRRASRRGRRRSSRRTRRRGGRKMSLKKLRAMCASLPKRRRVRRRRFGYDPNMPSTLNMEGPYDM